MDEGIGNEKVDCRFGLRRYGNGRRDETGEKLFDGLGEVRKEMGQ